MSSSTSARTSGATPVLTSAGTTNVFAVRSTWGDSPIEVTVYGDTERKFLDTGTGTTTTHPFKIEDFAVSSGGTSGFKLYWAHETKLDEAEREALIATVIDSIIAARDNPFSGLRAVLDGLSKPLESESPGFVYVPEGTGVTSTVWPGGSTYSPTTTTNWYSSTREGTFKTYNWEY